MIVEINGIPLQADFSIGTFVDIVEYKNRYEPHDKVTLSKYLTMVTDEERSIDTVCDLLYYPYAVRQRKMGLAPVITWRDVAVHILTNTDLVGAILKDLADSLPEPEAKKKDSATKARRKN
jgi:hypothetical protein